MRVLVIRNAYDKDAGGAEQYALNLCIALQSQAIQPLFMTRVPNLISKANAAGVPVKKGFWHSSQEWGKHYFARFPLMVVWYMWVILRNRIDVVHPQGRDDFIFATIAARILGKPVVWTDHADLKIVLNLEKHPFPYLRSWIIWAARYAKAIICVSESEMQEIRAVAPAQLATKLTLVHNGVFPPKNVQPQPKDARYVIATNARLVPEKGIAELISGFAKSRFVGESSLWIVGGHSGNVEHFTELARELQVADRIKFIDYVDHPNDYIAAADIFVHASYHEAFSLAIIEAAMLGKPIIATKTGGTPEIIKDDCGILVPIKDVPAITTAIDDLLANPQKMQQLGANAKKRAEAEYNFTTIVKSKVLSLYTS